MLDRRVKLGRAFSAPQGWAVVPVEPLDSAALPAGRHRALWAQTGAGRPGRRGTKRANWRRPSAADAVPFGAQPAGSPCPQALPRRGQAILQMAALRPQGPNAKASSMAGRRAIRAAYWRRRVPRLPWVYCARACLADLGCAFPKGAVRTLPKGSVYAALGQLRWPSAASDSPQSGLLGGGFSRLSGHGIRMPSALAWLLDPSSRPSGSSL